MDLDTASATSAAALLNAIRLHRDAILLFKHGRYPSAFQLSIQAQEELGKAFLLEEFIFRVNVKEHDPEDTDDLQRHLGAHRIKQVWFAKELIDVGTPPFDQRAIESQRIARRGRLERQRQRSAYVGGVDGRGRVRTPVSEITAEAAAERISQVSEVMISLTDGVLAGEFITDTDELADAMTAELSAELHAIWPVSR